MVINRQKQVPVRLRSLEAFCRRVSAALRVPPDAATICLVSNAQIAIWNRVYRGKPRPTDVLSFPAASQNGARRLGPNGKRKPPHLLKYAQHAEENYLGDIAIAPAVARRNARVLGRSFESEMRILALHGLLHLMGYDHEADHGAMDRIESRLRGKLGLS